MLRDVRGVRNMLDMNDAMTPAPGRPACSSWFELAKLDHAGRTTYVRRVVSVVYSGEGAESVADYINVVGYDKLGRYELSIVETRSAGSLVTKRSSDGSKVRVTDKLVIACLNAARTNPIHLSQPT